MTWKEPSKAIIQNRDTLEQIPVMYNPTEFTSTRNMLVSDLDDGVQFGTLVLDDLTVDLFFDTYEQRTDVRLLTNKITALQEPTTGAGAKERPPVCLFSWGGFQYTGVVKTVTQQFVMFLDTGIPVRANLAVTLANTPTTQQIEKNAGLDKCRKLCLVKSSDRLDVLAFKQTGLAARWRDIAALNNIEDPLAFPTAQDLGRRLVIPDYHQ